jgi:DNA helicase-2/ATP-dependent DNA helicase PcrA
MIDISAGTFIMGNNNQPPMSNDQDPEHSVTVDDFKMGDMVEHSIFGAGKIMVLSGTGENQRVGVIFKDGTKKKLIVKYANLSKIS